MEPKPYAIRPRVFLFACDVIRAFPRFRLDPPSLKVWTQMIAATTSVGAHLEEAASGGSRAHFLSLTRGALREMRESNYWIRLAIATELQGFATLKPLASESHELIAILATIVRRTYEKNEKQRTKNKDRRTKDEEQKG